MAEVIKASSQGGRVADGRVARDVSEILLRIEPVLARRVVGAGFGGPCSATPR
jgi:hypothetical protein